MYSVLLLNIFFTCASFSTAKPQAQWNYRPISATSVHLILNIRRICDFFCCMCLSSCSIACKMLAARAWLVTEEFDKNCCCINLNWPPVKATTVYLNYLSSNKCSVPLYTHVAQQFGGLTTFFWQAHQLWAAQLLHWEMLNTLVKIAMQQVCIYKYAVGSLSMGLTVLSNNKTQAC